MDKIRSTTLTDIENEEDNTVYGQEVKNEENDNEEAVLPALCQTLYKSEK